MNKLISNKQYHLATKSLEEIDVLVKLLKERGYKALHNLDNVLSFDRLPVGLCIDNEEKCIFTSNVTCMAGYCMSTNRKPLYVQEVIDNIETLIDKLDINFYNELLDKGNLEEYRPCGGIYRLTDIL